MKVFDYCTPAFHHTPDHIRTHLVVFEKTLYDRIHFLIVRQNHALDFDGMLYAYPYEDESPEARIYAHEHSHTAMHTITCIPVLK